MIILNDTWKVYIHQNKINGKVYVGITSLPLQKRFEANGTGYKRHNVKFWRAIEKYSWNGFDHILFADNLTENEANNMEAILIEKLDSIKNGYNCREGGKAGRLSDQTKALIREKRANQIISHESVMKSASKNRGQKRTEEFKLFSREMKKSTMKSVYCSETGIVYESISAAARALGLSKGFISQVCNNNISSAHGYHFCFANSND